MDMGVSAIGVSAIVTIVVAVGSAATAVGFIRSNNIALEKRLDGVEAQLQKIDDLLAKINELLVAVSESKGRMDRLDDRHVQLREQVDTLQRKFFDFTDIAGIYETRHRELDARMQRLESICKQLRPS